MKGQIYRIARPYDIATLFPIKEIGIIYELQKYAKLLLQLSTFIGYLSAGNYFGAIKEGFGFLSGVVDLVVNNEYRTGADYFYSQSGGLYMINDDTNTVYHCDDFYNEKRDHPLCKNHELKISFKIVGEIIDNFYKNRNYLTLDQDIMSGCQEKKLAFWKLKLKSIDWEDILLSRRLEINYNSNLNNNNKVIRKLKKIEDIQTIKMFEEISFSKNKFEFCFKYETTEKLIEDNLFLIINTKNRYFFGEICLSQNITWLNNQEFEKINCYFADTLDPFTIAINLKKEILDEKELYIYVRGKASGSLELYDLSKNKTLDILSSYIIPDIIDFPLEYSLNFILPKIEEDTYVNIIIYGYGLFENITNLTNSTKFEIYKNNDKINYTNDLILEKNNEYYFKYYPGLYNLIINFIPIYSNKFLEKYFYNVNKQTIRLCYNIESININQSFGLFFDCKEAINIGGYFSIYINENINNRNFYILNTYEKYFNLTKHLERYKYFNIDIKLESQIISKLIIYDFQEVIIIDKIDYTYKINKTTNYMFVIDETMKKNYEKIETYIVVSINNDNNIIKLLLQNGDITTSKNYLITKIGYIKGIYIKTNEDDIFTIKLISEEVYKYLSEVSSPNNYYSFIDDKKFSLDFIHSDEDVFVFYNPISTDLKIYEINNGSYFQLEDIINNKLNYSLLLNMKSLEEKKTHMILKNSSNPFLYENYIDNLIIDLTYRLYDSKICYLFMDFEYRFSYIYKIKSILMKVLNNDKNDTIYFYCNNKIEEIENNVQILDVESCNGTFHMLGNNHLIYFYLPLTVAESYSVIENEDNFELSDIYHFFLVPEKNEYNSINILLNVINEVPGEDVFLNYYIDYGIIPYSRNIEKRSIIFTNQTNFVIPNYVNLSKGDEVYFIYFRFNTTLTKLNAKIIYENIIYLEEQTYIILKPGINNIKFRRNIGHYLNITKFNKDKNSKAFYIIYKDEQIIEYNIINETYNIIYIEEPVYGENIKLKIENDDEILLRVSQDYFEDFSMISYNKNMDIEQIWNTLKIKFNTTDYKARLEYHLALIEKENNINPLFIHKKFYENNLIYKNTIYSSGNEPIEMNISLPNNTNDFLYNKDYTLIAYGKDIKGDNINYFYMDPLSLFIADPYNLNINEETTNIINIPKTNIIDNTIIDHNEPESPTDIKESNNVESDSSSISESSSTTNKNNIANNESTFKQITETTTKTTIKSVSSLSDAEEKTDKEDKNIIESSIIPTNSLEETDNPRDTISALLNDNKKNDNDNDHKINAIVIVFSIIGGIALLGGIIGYTLYYIKKNKNMLNNNTLETSINNLKK